MAPPISNPKVFRYPTTNLDVVDVSLGGIIGAPHYFLTSPFCAAFRGNAIWVFYGFIDSYTPIAPVSILLVKPNGDYCWYSTANNPESIILNATYNTCTFIGARTLIVGESARGHNQVVTIPDYFEPNGFVHISGYSFSYPPAPCTAVPNGHHIYYGENNALVEFTLGFDDDYQLFAGTYTVDSAGFHKVNSGYCGFYANGTNPLINDNVTADIYNGVTYGFTSGYFSRDYFGHLIGKNVEFYDLHGQFWYTANSTVTDGELNCAGTGKFPSYSLETYITINMTSSIYSGTIMHSIPSNNGCGACEFSACSAMSFQNALDFCNGINFVELYGTGGAYSVYVGGKVLSLRDFVDHSTYRVYITDISPDELPPLDPPPVVQSGPSIHSLLNFHRPVSIIGAYKT